MDLRERVVAAVESERTVAVTRRRRSFGVGDQHGDQLGEAASRDRQRRAWPDGRSQAEDDLRRASRLAVAADPGAETSPCAGSWPSSPSAASRSTTARSGSSSTPRSSASKKSVVAGERDRPDVARRRAQWTKYQGRIEPERLVFIDETWTKTNMAPLRGWAPRGERLHRQGPARPLEDHDLPGRPAPRPDRGAMAPRRADRRRELSASMSRRSSSRPCGPATSSSWTISASHKGKAVRQLIRAAGAKLLLPAQILARPEPHRAGLRQAQALLAKSRRANPRSRLRRHRPNPRDLHATGMRQLLHKLRI